MPCQYGLMDVAKCGGKLVGHVHGSVLSACAADRDRQIATIHIDIFGNPALQECEDVVVHIDESWLRIEKFGHFAIATGQSTKFDGPVRIWQAAQVEHEIGIGRNSILEAERLDQHG